MSERQQQQKCALPSEQHGTHRNEEDNDGGNLPQGKKKGCNSSRGNSGKRNRDYKHDGCKPQPSHLQGDDGNVKMANVQEDLQVKNISCAIQCNKKSVKLHNKGCVDIAGQKGGKPPEVEKRKNTQDGTLQSWFKVTVPDGIKYDKMWLMNSIQSHCSVPFTPVDLHYVKNEVRFFVQNASTASALLDVNHKICDKENRKIPIFVRASNVPYSVRDKLEPKEMEQLKLTMQKRYDVSKKSLDLQSLRYDPDFVDLDIDIILNRRSYMTATLQIIERNFPELLSLNLCNNKLYQLDGLSDVIQMVPTVKVLNLSRNELKLVRELDKMKGLKLEELWLYGNPLCSTFPDQPTYISAIRKSFPELLRLDGQVLPPPIIVDVDRRYLTKPCEECNKGNEAMKYIILQFLQQYYFIYDYGDRRSLFGAYHDEACFSMTIPFNPLDPDSSSLCEYFKDNRNMKNLKDPYMRVQLLKHTKCDIVCSLCVLPKTQHDLHSFVVDMWFHTERMVYFSVNGVFKEVEGSSQGSVRAFSRTFIAVPASNSGIYIMNDELFVRDIIPNKTQSTLFAPMPAAVSPSWPTLSQNQQEIVQAFSIHYGICLHCSHMCLQGHQWNYIRVVQFLTMLKATSRLPKKALKETP